MRLVCSLPLLGMLIVASGCGGPTAPVEPQAQVSGTVTNDGKPVTLDSRVVFYNKEKGLSLVGTLDSLGKYSLVPADPKIGVPAGRYEVAITPPVPAAVEVNQNSPDYAKMMQSGPADKQPQASNLAPDIPEKFRDPATSKLVFEVKAGPNTYDFDLGKL